MDVTGRDMAFDDVVVDKGGVATGQGRGQAGVGLDAVHGVGIDGLDLKTVIFQMTHPVGTAATGRGFVHGHFRCLVGVAVTGKHQGTQAQGQGQSFHQCLPRCWGAESDLPARGDSQNHQTMAAIRARPAVLTRKVVISFSLVCPGGTAAGGWHWSRR